MAFTSDTFSCCFCSSIIGSFLWQPPRRWFHSIIQQKAASWMLHVLSVVLAVKNALIQGNRMEGGGGERES